MSHRTGLRGAVLLGSQALLASTAFAQSTPAPATGPTFADLVNNSLVPFVDGYIVPLLYIIAFLFFIFGMFRYFFTGGEENREKGRAFVLWGLIGMVLLFTVWGFVHLMLSLIPGT